MPHVFQVLAAGFIGDADIWSVGPDIRIGVLEHLQMPSFLFSCVKPTKVAGFTQLGRYKAIFNATRRIREVEGNYSSLKSKMKK